MTCGTVPQPQKDLQMIQHRIHRPPPLLPLIAGSLLLSYSAAVQANIEQFSIAQCAQLEAALELNREQQRRGYKLKQELKIKAQQAQLELQLHYHCQQPQDLQKPTRTGRASARKPPTGRTKTADRHLRSAPATTARTGTKPTLTVSVIAVKAPYQGAKLDAWLAYYQAPFYCFAVRHTERIRQCVEQRQQAQQRFELQYRNNVPGPGQ